MSLLGFAASFDAAALTPAGAGEVVVRCARWEAAIGSLKALAAARAAEGEGWKSEGFRSPADQLARRTGVSAATARRTLETGSRLAEQPEVAAAARAGRLSGDQAALVSAGVAANPAKSTELLDAAAVLAVPELAGRVAQIKADSVDREARRREIHAKRSLRRWRDVEGGWNARAFGNPEDGIGLWDALDPIRRHLIVRRRGTEPNEPLDAIDFDALMTLAAIATGREGELGLADLVELGLFPQIDQLPRVAPKPDEPARPDPAAPPAEPGPPAEPLPADLFASASQPPREPVSPPPPAHASPPVSAHAGPPGRKVAGSPAKVIIRVDYDTLLRGVPLEGELCEIAGAGPVPVSLIDELLATGNTFVASVLTKSHQVVGVYHHGRRPNAHQQSALQFIYPTCAAAGCTASTGLQTDHREDWAKTHYTVLDLLDQLCPFHHNKKTREGWALIHGTGKRPFVPPHDPRHPKHAKHPASIPP